MPNAADLPDHPLETPEALGPETIEAAKSRARHLLAVATSKNSQLAMDQNSSAHNSLYIYIVSNYPFCGVIILNHTHMGFWLTTWGLVVVCWSRSFVFVVKSKPSTLKKNKNQSVWQTTGTRSSKFFKLVRTRDKKILVFSDLGLDNQGPDLVDISQKIGPKGIELAVHVRFLQHSMFLTIHQSRNHQGGLAPCTT